MYLDKKLHTAIIGLNNNIKDMDPKRIASYEDVLKVIDKPQKLIIDVRNPDEVSETGKIPSSINIPCKSI